MLISFYFSDEKDDASKNEPFKINESPNKKKESLSPANKNTENLLSELHETLTSIKSDFSFASTKDQISNEDDVKVSADVSSIS